MSSSVKGRKEISETRKLQKNWDLPEPLGLQDEKVVQEKQCFAALPEASTELGVYLQKSIEPFQGSS